MLTSVRLILPKIDCWWSYLSLVLPIIRQCAMFNIKAMSNLILSRKQILWLNSWKSLLTEADSFVGPGTSVNFTVCQLTVPFLTNGQRQDREIFRTATRLDNFLRYCPNSTSCAVWCVAPRRIRLKVSKGQSVTAPAAWNSLTCIRKWKFIKK